MLAVVVSGVLIILGILGIKYGIEAILLGFTFLAIWLGLKKD